MSAAHRVPGRTSAGERADGAERGLRILLDPVEVTVEWPRAIVRCVDYHDDRSVRGCGWSIVLSGYPSRDRLERAAAALADRHRFAAGLIPEEEAVLRIVARNPGRFPKIMRRVSRATAACEAEGGECARRGHARLPRWPTAAVPRRA